MEIVKSQAFSIDMEDPTSTYTLQGEKIQSNVKLPPFLLKRLANKTEKPELTKEQLQEKLSKAEAMRLYKLDQRKLKLEMHSRVVATTEERKQ